MKQAVLCALFLSAAAPLAACDPHAQAQTLADKQIVCSLTGDAFIFNEDRYGPHSTRSSESDVLCQPLKARIQFKDETPSKETK